jgi:MerR family copper efflux transcriptional regulator
MRAERMAHHARRATSRVALLLTAAATALAAAHGLAATGTHRPFVRVLHETLPSPSCTPSRSLEGQDRRRLGAMLIGEAARQSGVPAPTIRFYEDRLLITPAARSPSGYRIYSGRVVAELRFVQQAQNLGFSLDEVREIVALTQTGGLPCARVAALCRHHIEDIDRRLIELREFRSHLLLAERQAARQCGVSAEGFCAAIMTEGPVARRAAPSRAKRRPKKTRARAE